MGKRRSGRRWRWVRIALILIFLCGIVILMVEDWQSAEDWNASMNESFIPRSIAYKYSTGRRQSGVERLLVKLGLGMFLPPPQPCTPMILIHQAGRSESYRESISSNFREISLNKAVKYRGSYEKYDLEMSTDFFSSTVIRVVLKPENLSETAKWDAFYEQIVYDSLTDFLEKLPDPGNNAEVFRAKYSAGYIDFLVLDIADALGNVLFTSSQREDVLDLFKTMCQNSMDIQPKELQKAYFLNLWEVEGRKHGTIWKVLVRPDVIACYSDRAFYVLASSDMAERNLLQ